MQPTKIFLVEDEFLIVMELQDRLGRQGYTVCGSALRGEEALERIPAAQPDLVIMDVNLGDGINGIETSKRLRGLVDVPVIFLTAYSDERTLEQARGAEPACFLVKPFEERELRANIEMATYRHQMERKLRDANLLLQEHSTELEAVNQQLRDALGHVKQLSGLLPICAWCKRIRDDKDYWHSLESYLATYTDTTPTHGICPICFESEMGSSDEETETAGDAPHLSA